MPIGRENIFARKIKCEFFGMDEKMFNIVGIHNAQNDQI
jgi:hypothetical protein